MSEFSEIEREGENGAAESADTSSVVSETSPCDRASEPCIGEAETPLPRERIVYRWNYDEQTAYDASACKRERRRGVILYACVLSAVFLLCIAVLLGVILWSGGDGASWGEHDLSAIGTVAQSIAPTTVLIEAEDERGISSGTGFFLTESGYIATNHHVIDGADSIKVTLYSGTSYTAEVVGYYALDDLAVLKINGSGFPALRMGNSSTVLLGDTVVVVGNPSGRDASWTTTHGIISSTDRRVTVSDGDTVGVMKLMQTDAPVNPGNSGGPLCNLRGEVIGIITQKLSGYEGIGFAIPINEAMNTLQAIIDGDTEGFTSTVTKKRPSIGIMVENIEKGNGYHIDGTSYVAPCDGLLVADVTKGSGAEGVLLYGDLLYEFDGRTVENTQDLQNALFTKQIGDRVKVKVYRGSQSLELTVTLS